MGKEESKEESKEKVLVKKEFINGEIAKIVAIFSPMVLVKYPYFVSLGRRSRKREILYEAVESGGVKVKWQVKSRDYLPGEMELKVWCWILERISEAPKPLPIDLYIPYTLTGIAKYWDMPTAGKTLSLIARAIENLHLSGIWHWIQKPGEGPNDLKYSLLIGKVGRGEKINETIIDRNALFLNPIVIKFLNEAPIKPSSLEEVKFFADKNLIALRIYELLGWKFWSARMNGENKVSIKYSELVKRVGLRKEKYKSVATQQLSRSHEALKERKIISEAPKWKDSNGDWVITYKIGKTLIKEMEEWAKKKQIKAHIKQLELKTAPQEVDYAIGEVLGFIKKGKREEFEGLVRKILKKPNGQELIYKAISETKAEVVNGRVKNKTAYLITILKKYSG